MNIITELTRQIEDYRKENKTPCKNYKTQAAAEKATAAAAANIGECFDREGKSANYIVFYIEAWGRWVGCIEMSEVLRRPTAVGGYLGVEPGFFKF